MSAWLFADTVSELLKLYLHSQSCDTPSGDGSRTAGIPHPHLHRLLPIMQRISSVSTHLSANEWIAKRCTRCEEVISPYPTSLEDITCFVSHIPYNRRSSLPCFGRKENLCLNNRALPHLNFTSTKYLECFLDVTDKNVLSIVFIKIKLILFTKIIERRPLCYKCVTEFFVESFYFIIELQYKVIKM